MIRFRKHTHRTLELRNLKDNIVGPSGLALTLALAVVAAIVILLALSERPGEAAKMFLLGPFMSVFHIGNWLNKAGTLMLTGLAVVIAFRASTFNLGGEGQVYSGALAATVVCLALPTTGGVMGVGLALVGGAGLGALFGGICGAIRTRWGANELISSYLLSAASILMVDALITGPLDDPVSNLLATGKIATDYWLPAIWPPSYLNTGIFISLTLVAAATLFLFRTRAGYNLRMSGLNPEFARFGGISVGTYVIVPMALSGALHGLAGGIAVLGTYHMCVKGFSVGLGWNGIAVALIGRNHPLGVIPAALLFAYLEAGAGAASLFAGVPAEVAMLIQSIVFYLITAQALFTFLEKRRKI